MPKLCCRRALRAALECPTWLSRHQFPLLEEIPSCLQPGAPPLPAPCTHRPRSCTEEMGFFRCRTHGTREDVWASGGSEQRGSQRRPWVDASSRPRLAVSPGCPPRRGGAAGSLLALAPLSGRACSAAGSPATLRARPLLSTARSSWGQRALAAAARLPCPVCRWLLGARSLGPPH